MYIARNSSNCEEWNHFPVLRYSLVETGFHISVLQQKHSQCERTSQACCCSRMWCETTLWLFWPEPNICESLWPNQKCYEPWCSVMSHSSLKKNGLGQILAKSYHNMQPVSLLPNKEKTTEDNKPRNLIDTLLVFFFFLQGLFPPKLFKLLYLCT